MWQAPNQKARAAGKARSGNRNRRSFHIKRITAEMRLLASATPGADADARPPVPVRLMLNDISPKGIGLFATEALIAGQDVAIMLQEPAMIYLKGKVVYCQEHDINSHVLSKTPYSFRIGIELRFESPAEEAAVKKFCDDLARMILAVA